MINKKQKISLIVPTYNEKENIENMLFTLSESLDKNKINYEIIVVDDKSTDGTIDIVNKLKSEIKGLKLMVRGRNPGFGYSLLDGSKEASGELICWVMADLSDDFEVIPKMMEIIDEGADMVIGSRNISGGSRGDQGKLKALGSAQFSAFAKILFKLPVYDITNAFRTFRKELINKIPLENNNFAISPEFALRAHVAGYKLAEIPVTYKDRNVGEAKTKLFSMGLKYYGLLIKYWLQNLSGKFRTNF